MRALRADAQLPLRSRAAAFRGGCGPSRAIASPCGVGLVYVEILKILSQCGVRMESKALGAAS